MEEFSIDLKVYLSFTHKNGDETILYSIYVYNLECDARPTLHATSEGRVRRKRSINNKTFISLISDNRRRQPKARIGRSSVAFVSVFLLNKLHAREDGIYGSEQKL